MKTMNREISERQFYEIKYIESLISNLGSYIQNPDFVNKTNARQNFNDFDDTYDQIIDRLEKLREKVFDLHQDILK